MGGGGGGERGREKIRETLIESPPSSVIHPQDVRNGKHVNNTDMLVIFFKVHDMKL